MEQKEQQQINLEKCIDHPKYKEYMKNWIRFNYELRPLPEKGLRYKRNGLDNLHDRGLLNPEDLKVIFIQILRKQSLESSEIRRVVTELVVHVLQKVHKYIQEHETEQVNTEVKEAEHGN